MRRAGATRLALVLVALLYAVRAIAAGADFKIPPTPDHHVTDSAGVLYDSTQSWLENDLQAYEQETGHQIVVWIGKSTGDVPLETWTGETADHWKIGRKGHDDGAVLFVFMRDRKVRIEVGYGLESALTDADSFRIIQNDILPRMKAGDPNAAIVNGVVAMLQTITPTFQNVAPTQTPVEQAFSGKDAWVLVVLGLIFFFALFVIFTQATRRGGYLITGGGLFGGGGGFGGFGGGGFSAGGGGFGGGGASGGW